MHHKSYTRLRRIALMLSIALPVTACDSESDANATAGPAAKGAAAGTTRAQPPAKALAPAALAAWENYARSQCALEDAHFTPVAFAPVTNAEDSKDKGGFITADFNGDGQPDFLVVKESRGCATQGPPYGNAGPPNDFIVSTTAGYRVFDGFMGWIGPAMIARRGDRDVLNLPGGFNGRCGPVTTVTWGWTGTAIDAVERRNESGQLVDREGCAVSAQRPATQGGGGSFPPIEPGYWAAGGTCSAVIADALEIPIDQTGLSHFTEKQGWSGRFEVLRYSALGGNRWRMHGREHTEIGDEPAHRDIVVNSRTSFTELGEFGARYTHCPTSQIPRSLRGEFER